MKSSVLVEICIRQRKPWYECSEWFSRSTAKILSRLSFAASARRPGSVSTYVKGVPLKLRKAWVGGFFEKGVVFRAASAQRPGRNESLSAQSLESDGVARGV